MNHTMTVSSGEYSDYWAEDPLTLPAEEVAAFGEREKDREARHKALCADKERPWKEKRADAKLIETEREADFADLKKRFPPPPHTEFHAF